MYEYNYDINVDPQSCKNRRKEKVDTEARQNKTKHGQTQDFQIAHTDINKHIKTQTRTKWQTEWNDKINLNNRLGKIKMI